MRTRLGSQEQRESCEVDFLIFIRRSDPRTSVTKLPRDIGNTFQDVLARSSFEVKRIPPVSASSSPRSTEANHAS